jgi:OOP family OmpA-OmpF porin
MKAILSIALAAVLATALAPRAGAQLGARSLEVEPFVGWMNFDNDLRVAAFNTTLSQAINVPLEDKVGFGARVAYNFTPSWGLEGTFNYVPNVGADLTDEQDALGFRSFDTNIYLAHANLNYNFLFNQSKLVPFLTAGGGLVNFNPDNDDQIGNDSNTDGLVNFGGGLKLFLTETVGIRGDVRDHLIFHSIPNQDPDEPGDEKDAETTSNLEFSGGITFNF